VLGRHRFEPLRQQLFRFASPTVIRTVSVGAPVNDHEVSQLELLGIDNLLRPTKNLGMSASLSESKLKRELFATFAWGKLGQVEGKQRAAVGEHDQA
jgi:hypothetical protein